jgi:putative MATE family efflux protein
MKDMTHGSIRAHLIGLAAPIAFGMLFQTLYFLVDLYFVAGLGGAAIAGVGSAGNASFLILALTQVLGVGTVALIAQAVGRKDQAAAMLLFNQSLLLSLLGVVGSLLFGYALAPVYVAGIGADAATRAAGLAYLHWYLPGLALQFALVGMGSALRGTGIARPTTVVQIVTVLLNIVLTPVLITGWGTRHPMGVAGAGLASSISVAVGVLLLWLYFRRLEHYVNMDARLWRPQPAVWRQILAIGLPAGAEFLLMFALLSFIYWLIRPFGAVAQAGYGIGSRVMQAVFLPTMALAFAVAPVAGQNYGARHFGRVRETFRTAAAMSVGLMIAVTVLCQLQPQALIRPFTGDAAVIAVGSQYLRITSWNFAAIGVIFSCSGAFQAIGNTVPAMLSSASRLLSFVLPAWWWAQQQGFALHDVLYLSVFSVALQAILSLLLLRRQFRLRLA